MKTDDEIRQEMNDQDQRDYLASIGREPVLTKDVSPPKGLAHLIDTCEASPKLLVTTAATSTTYELRIYKSIDGKDDLYAILAAHKTSPTSSWKILYSKVWQGLIGFAVVTSAGEFKKRFLDLHGDLLK